jgi:hypothetical protein
MRWDSLDTSSHNISPHLLVEFQTQEYFVFNRGELAYERLVRPPRPTRDGR